MEIGDIALARAVAAELTRLRRGDGVTRTKLARCPTLLELPCMTRESQRRDTQANASTEERTIKAMHVLTSLLAEDMKLRYSAVRNAFAIGSREDPGTLTHRRLLFADTHGISVDTVRNWEREGIYELSLHLIELGMNSEAPVVAQAPFSPLDARENYEIEILSVDMMYRYGHGRQLASRLEVVTVEALIDGAKRYVYRLFYSAGAELVSAEGIDGCKVTISRPRWEGNTADRTDEMIVRVEFDRALACGEQYRIIYRLNNRTGPRDPEPRVYTTVTHPTRAIKLRVQFADLVPDTVQAFRSPARDDPKLRDLLAELEPANGYLESDFPAPALGSTYGLGWEWPEATSDYVASG